MKTFVTLFVHNPSVSHLYKDPGTILYCMARLGYEAKYVSFLREEQIPKSMRDSLSPMKLETLENDVDGDYTKMGRSKSAFKYLWKNAKQISVGFNERVEHGKIFAWSRICQRLDDCLKNMMKS